MLRTTPILVLAMLAAASACAETVMPLWEGGLPPGEKDTPNREATKRDADGERRTRDVTRPSITVHLPEASKANGAAVVICPGGGYRHLAIDKEGHDLARWFNTFGVAGIVLSYRVVPSDTPPDGARALRGPIAAKALADAERAIRVVKAHADAWRIDPDRVGIIGFSAGAHVVVNTGLHFDSGETGASDPVERLSSRPAFLGVIYGPVPEGADFPKDTPPAFIAHAADDRTVPAANSTRLFEAIRKAGAPAELHIYERGGHGFGVRAKNIPTDTWTERLRDWMALRGILK
ncbi:MAG: alpha/beta hydrolase [Bryobacteraceae bacterium]